MNAALAGLFDSQVLHQCCDSCRSLLEGEIRRTQERLERIKASVKKSDDQESRQNLRKRPPEQEPDAVAEPQKQQSKSMNKKPNITLSHLGDEDE